MAKRNLKKEKALRNEEFAKRFKPDRFEDRKDRERKKRPGTWNNWCRVKGHPATCSCVLPSRSEIIELSRGRR